MWFPFDKCVFKKLYTKKNAISDYFGCFLNCMFLRREHTVFFSISYLLTVFLSIALNKLPCSYSHGTDKRTDVWSQDFII